MTFEEYFNSLDKSAIWLYDLQVDLANEAIAYSKKYAEIMNVPYDNLPYRFTMREIVEGTEDLLKHLDTPGQWDLSPDTKGGVFAMYSGSDYNIFSLEFKENCSICIEYIENHQLQSRCYSWELPTGFIIKEINKILEKVKVLESVENE